MKRNKANYALFEQLCAATRSGGEDDGGANTARR